MANYYIGKGASWSNIKLFSKFYFGEKNIENFQVKKREDKSNIYIIWMNKKFYYENKVAVNRFEDYFLMDIRPLGE